MFKEKAGGFSLDNTKVEKDIHYSNRLVITSTKKIILLSGRAKKLNASHIWNDPPTFLIKWEESKCKNRSCSH